MKYPFVECIVNERGNAVKNQFIIQYNEGVTFQSYHTIIACFRIGNTPVIDISYRSLSQTTKRYLKIFLSESYKETCRKVEEGEYILDNLNA